MRDPPLPACGERLTRQSRAGEGPGERRPSAGRTPAPHRQPSPRKRGEGAIPRSTAAPPRRARTDRAARRSACPRSPVELAGRARRVSRASSRAAPSRSPSTSMRAMRKPRQAGLAGAEHLAFAAQPQILLGDAEAVLGLAHHLEPRLRRLARAAPCRAGGRSRRRSPRPTRPRSWWSWASPKRSACSITMIGRLGHVDADLDHRRRDQDRGLAARRSAPSRRPCSRAGSACRARGRRRRRSTSRSSAKRSSAAARSTSSDSATSGQIQ